MKANINTLPENTQNEMKYAVNIVNFDDERDITTVAMFYDKWSCTKFVAATIGCYLNDGFDVVIEELK